MDAPFRSVATTTATLAAACAAVLWLLEPLIGGVAFVVMMAVPPVAVVAAIVAVRGGTQEARPESRGGSVSVTQTRAPAASPAIGLTPALSVVEQVAQGASVIVDRRGFFARAQSLSTTPGRRHCIAVIGLAPRAPRPDGRTVRGPSRLEIVRMLPAESVIGRLSPNELGVILLDETCIGAATILEEARPPLSPEDRSMAPSIGVTDWLTGDESIDVALGRADHALYRAKQLGRGRIEVSPRSATDQVGSSDLAPLARRR